MSAIDNGGIEVGFKSPIYSYLNRVKLRDAWLSFFALLVLIGVLLFPRLSLGQGASARLEDVASLFIFFLVVVKLLTRKIVVTRWMLLAFVYFTYLLLVSVTRYVVGESSVGFIIFFGKEAQYFCFAVAFYYLISEGHELLIWNSALLLSVLVALWGGGQLITGHISYYGISAPFLASSPSLSGQVYWFCSVIVLSYLLLYRVSPVKTNILYFIAALNVLSCVATISRSSGLGVFTFLVVCFVGRYFVLVKKRISIYALLVRIVFVVVGVATIAILIMDAPGIFSKLSRYDDLIAAMYSRYEENWSVRIELLQSSIDVLMGLGCGVAHMIDGRMAYGMAYDSQYMRNILELGVVGSSLWFAMLVGFGWYLRSNNRVLLIYLALLISFLVAGVGFEAFNLSKSGSFFWLMTGILFGIIHREKQLKVVEVNILDVKA